MSKDHDQPVAPTADNKAPRRLGVGLYRLPICILLPTTITAPLCVWVTSIIAGGVETHAYEEAVRHLALVFLFVFLLTFAGTLAWLGAFVHFVYDGLSRRRWVWRNFWLLVGGLFSNYFVVDRLFFQFVFRTTEL